MAGRPSHGTLIARAPAGSPGVFTTIGSLGDIQMPGLSRNEHETTDQNHDIDQFVLGVLRRDPVTFPIFFDADDGTHDAQTGLQQAIIDNEVCGWRITQADGLVWIFSGGVSAMKATAPVDGVQTANVTIRPSGPFSLDGSIVGG